VLCHVLLLARFHDIDLEAEIEATWLRLGREPPDGAADGR